MLLLNKPMAPHVSVMMYSTVQSGDENGPQNLGLKINSRNGNSYFL